MNFLKQLSTHQAGILAVVVAAILWSTGGLFIKLLPFDPFTILFYRSAIAAVLFGYICRHKLFAINRKNVIAILFYTALLVSFVVATKMTTAANAIFLQYTAPIYVLLMEPLLFRLKLQRINVVTILICIAGMLLFFIGDLQVGDMGGNALALLSGICLAGFMLTQRVNDPDKQEVSIFWGNVAVALVGLPWFLESAAPTLPQWGMIAFLGFVQIGLGYLLFTYGLKRTLAVESALIAMLEPILNPVWVFIGYGERPANLAILGGLIIIAALVIRTIVTERAKFSKKPIAF